jgi:hypothetical protein
LKPLSALGIALVLAGNAQAQSTPTDYRDEFMRHFEQSSRKLISLSDAIPQELYTWSPSEGVMPIAQVYMHIARYNYMYPEDALGISPPDGVDLDELESITDKEQVKRLLRQSVEHVRLGGAVSATVPHERACGTVGGLRAHERHRTAMVDVDEVRCEQR